MIITLKKPRPSTSDQILKHRQNICDTAEFYLPEMCDDIKELMADGKMVMFCDASQPWDYGRDSCTLLGIIHQYAKLKGIDLCFVRNFHEVKDQYYARLEAQRDAEEAEEAEEESGAEEVKVSTSVPEADQKVEAGDPDAAG